MKERGAFVLGLSKKISRELKPFTKKLIVAGSIRRGEKNPGDIDIVLIPKNKEKIKEFLTKKGKFLLGGENKAYFIIQGVHVELYYTTSEEFGATLLSYSSKRGSEIGLRIQARKKGFKLNQHGLFSLKTGKKVAGKTEREIYKALGRPYKEPALR